MKNTSRPSLRTEISHEFFPEYFLENRTCENVIAADNNRIPNDFLTSTCYVVVLLEKHTAFLTSIRTYRDSDVSAQFFLSFTVIIIRVSPILFNLVFYFSDFAFDLRIFFLYAESNPQKQKD